MSSAESIKILEGHVDAVYCLKILPTQKLASGSIDKTIRIWDLITDSCIKILTDHTKRIFSLCLSEEKNIFFSGSGDSLIKVIFKETN